MKEITKCFKAKKAQHKYLPHDPLHSATGRASFMPGHVLVREVASRPAHHSIGILTRQGTQIGYTSMFGHTVEELKKLQSAMFQRHLAIWICTCVSSSMAVNMA